MDHSLPGIADLKNLEVRPLRSKEEEDRWNHEMRTHHYLGFNRLVGETVKHVALLEERWVALLGWGSAAYQSSLRDRYLGWPEDVRSSRLRYITNNQRFLILPEGRIKNLASRVLALSCRRLPEDFQHFFGHRVVLVETFVDPARFAGTCYKGAGWTPLGRTRGFGYHSGRYRPHGCPKILWVRPLVRSAREQLCRPFLSSALSGEESRMIADLSTLNLTQGPTSLKAALSQVVDGRKKRGIRHSPLSVFLVSAAAMLSGMKSFRAIGEFARRLSQDALLRLECREKPDRTGSMPPSEPTIRRVLQNVDIASFEECVGSWLLSQSPGSHISVDGKTLRGSRTPTEKGVHLLSAVLGKERVTIAQKSLPDKTNEITQIKPLLAPLDLSGHVVTADALHTQTEFARWVTDEKKADDLLIAKDNQETLKKDIDRLDFEAFSPSDGKNGR